jgi:hypothetical protein
MENPFLKRATEYLKNPEAFIGVVTPAPLRHYFYRKGESAALYDRLAMVLGRPGSGKTTIARVLEFPTLMALLRNENIEAHRSLIATLADCGALHEREPSVLGCRLPLETDYREFWELPYPEEIRTALLLSLIQSRAVLGWLRYLETALYRLEDVYIIPTAHAQASIDAVGGRHALAMRERARAIESAIYGIVGAIVAPKLENLHPDAISPYRPFDVIEKIVIPAKTPGETTALQPLVVLDDAHLLHPSQFAALKQWLLRRELRVARWIVTRLDVMSPDEALSSFAKNHGQDTVQPGITVNRDITVIILQSLSGRLEERVFFRRMARDMAGRYLRRMPIFNDRNLTNFASLLLTQSSPITPPQLKKLREDVAATQRRLHISDKQAATLRATVDRYLGDNRERDADVALAMLRILLHRFARRMPTASLFDDFDEEAQPKRAPTADASVYEGARIHLLHEFDRPYYYGIEDVCDSGSENAEQFLRLAAPLVDAIADRIQRRKEPSLSSAEQHRILRDLAARSIREWDFPERQLVRQLATGIGERCKRKSLEPNAPLGYGANAFGILQEAFDHIPQSSPALASVLKYAVAYNAVTLVPYYECKHRTWCLLELGGMPSLEAGLTLRRGGFIEGTVEDLRSMLELGEG